MPFIASWCSENNLKKILNDTFGTFNSIDSKIFNKNLKTIPKGLLVHWIAGNVPTLGFLSLILGIITKNKNIVRLPTFAKNILEDLLIEFKKTDKIALEICRNILILNYDKSNIDVSKKLSNIADVRLIWGSDETCKTIKSYETKLHCDDLIFSNKVSLIIIDKKTLKNKKQDYIKKISKDILVFDQKACASPHTIFLEKASNREINEFCKKLSENLYNNHRKYKFSKTTKQKKIEILNLRLQSSIKGKVYTRHNDFSNTVLYNTEKGLGPNIENGTIFVKKLPSIDQLKKTFPTNIQTLGVVNLNKNLKKYVLELTKKNLARVKSVGEMTNFENIWDGMSIALRVTKFMTISNKIK